MSKHHWALAEAQTRPLVTKKSWLFATAQIGRVPYRQAQGHPSVPSGGLGARAPSHSARGTVTMACAPVTTAHAPAGTGSPWGEGAAVCDEAWPCRRSSAVWLFLGLRSGFAVLIFLGRPRFRPAIFRPFLFSFFFRALEGDGFLMAVAPAFSSSAPES